MVAAFALALVAWGLPALAIRFADEGTYAAIARETGFADQASFVLPADEPGATPTPVTLATLLGWHREWTAYVLGRSAAPPNGRAVFTKEETSHMTDVRSVFAGAQAVLNVGAVATVLLFGFALRGGPRAAGVLLRDGSLVAVAGVLLVGLGAVVAFDQLFLLFHRVFFPQGNFLFDPATSNLLRLYPDPYWHAVTLRVAGAFVALALALASLGWILARGAIVTRR